MATFDLVFCKLLSGLGRLFDLVFSKLLSGFFGCMGLHSRQGACMLKVQRVPLN